MSKHTPKPSRGSDMTIDRLAEITAAIESPLFSHSRSRNFCGWVTHIYHRDPGSPTGVICVAGGNSGIVDPLIRKLRNTSPLSPTEGF